MKIVIFTLNGKFDKIEIKVEEEEKANPIIECLKVDMIGDLHSPEVSISTIGHRIFSGYTMRLVDKVFAHFESQRKLAMELSKAKTEEKS